MTEQKNKIPIKGYATFDPLKHCWIGSGFKAEWFHDLPIYKNNKIMDPIKRIADETEEDYQALAKILEDAGVAILPGTSFGEFGEGFVRICYAVNQDKIKNALERIKKSISKLDL